MVRHPNYSGMQMDQVTRFYVPAHFISSITIWQGDDLLLARRERDFNFGKSRVSLRLPPQRRNGVPRRGAGQQGRTFKRSWSVARA